MNIDMTQVPAEYKRAAAKDSQGTITDVSYPVRNYINSSRQLVTDQNICSKEAGRETVEGDTIIKKCNIYLPPGYEENDTGTRYNVLYLLHGVGGNRYEWLNGSGKEDDNFIICNIFDNLIAKGQIEPTIVVFPEGRSAHDWMDTTFNSDGTNLLGFYYFDYELRYDLIPFIESQYNTYANIKDTSPEGIAYNRLHRAIAGLSMGGMQALNLILGGHRCDSTAYTNTMSPWKNGLDMTVLAPGMLDLLAYVGAFSNAPTSSDGKVLGTGIASCDHRLSLLYITCGDKDEISIGQGYKKATHELLDTAGDNLDHYYRVVIKDGIHDFNVWNNGAFNFIRLSFRNATEYHKRRVVTMTL
ncbi:MAG: alpha/beta hydrolase-fold protein [Caldicoprobacterales bacterium]|jgi:S-formylglutathione hydrolase FrmB